jgi:hypothetical protein
VLTALVDSAQLSTVVSDDGQMMTEMRLAIRNNGRPHLEIELPQGAKMWSAFVAGQPVRPIQRAGKLLLPLERSVGDAPVAVEMVYVGAYAFPKTKGEVGLISPKLDLPLKNVRWELYLPPDYNYSKYGGSMTHETASAPVVQVFSQMEYYQQEVQKKAELKSVAINNLRNLKQSIATGKLGGNESYNYFRNPDIAQDAETAREFKALEKDYKRRQSSNLIMGQNAYVIENVGKLGDAQMQQRLNIAPNQPAKPQAQQQAEQQVVLNDYDLEVAEQQWDRLEKAQQVKVTKVQPLRANLPTRGQRHLFTQILQTEENKPLTISFSAANAREPSWLGRLAWGALGFIVLWIVVASVAARKKAVIGT